MPNLPTTDDVRKLSEQALAVARTPLLAALGAGDLAAKAIAEVLTKAKSRLAERADAAKAAVDELPTDLGGLREKLDPAELRKLADAYTQSAVQLYQYLAEHGEETLDRLRAQPQVQQAIKQVGDAVDAGRQRAETAAGEARDLADDVLGKVTRRTRAAGEQVADGIDTATERVAETVERAGAEVASKTRGATRKAANRTAPSKSTGPGDTDKNTR
ncbi:hypothetical protein [Goodfellowiella coeruleoviolacea]|uniref:Heparin binding hemagglutinin HbhA n=1 Tax=Goodfellowiella coeruleoviolacea TaxID=334858 RepID=A0AAE3GE23_9PSEU|nr:hypothetical protein [Goodfellowiella coeruleoviolacea]MCP2166038.1 heparin binding hemagglutinin HbhA [Goodfellowiella coeruleoviolacea]